ncbi:carboxymuconolactone decarboxylase family protein [Bradyrhizobium manausense]
MSAIAGQDHARIPLLALTEMTPEQRRVYDKVVSGPRGRLIGPLRAAMQSPELAGRWSDLGEFLRFQTCLPARLSELAIISVGRRWTAQVEWWVHARTAIEAGLSSTVVEAIRDIASPVFNDRADFEVYEFTRELQTTGQVSEATYAAVMQRWGARGAVELTAVIGYYTMVSMTLNAHRIPVPETHEPLPEVGALVDLPPARLREGHS